MSDFPPRPKLSLVFPMAGQGARFGYQFKPFLDIRGRSFIEAAFAPFRAWLPDIAGIYFIFTREQERTHQVSARLATMFAGLPWKAVILDRPTQGPAQTLQQCLEAENIHGPIMACDCDHALDVSGLVRAAYDARIACAVPTWSLDGESIASWSVAAVAEDGLVAAVKEKSLPDGGGDFRGVIGCYYFADAARVRGFLAGADLLYLSDLVARHIETGDPVLSVAVRQANFFGDPARLARVAALQA